MTSVQNHRQLLNGNNKKSHDFSWLFLCRKFTHRTRIFITQNKGLSILD